MQEIDILKIIAVLEATYPKTFVVTDKQATVNAWKLFLDEYSYNDIQLALKTYIKTSNSSFPPSVAELIGMVNKPRDYEYMDEQSAWGMVRRAICNGNYGAETEFAKLPEIIQAVVGSPTMIRMWAQSDLANIDTVIASNFMRSYREKVKRDKEFKTLPREVQSLIEDTQRNMILSLED